MTPIIGGGPFREFEWRGGKRQGLTPKTRGRQRPDPKDAKIASRRSPREDNKDKAKS
jgi:hypothetical protein